LSRMVKDDKTCSEPPKKKNPKKKKNRIWARQGTQVVRDPGKGG